MGKSAKSALSIFSSRVAEPGSDSKWLEAELMLEFVVFRVVMNVFEDSDGGTRISFRDLLAQARALGSLRNSLSHSLSFAVCLFGSCFFRML